MVYFNGYEFIWLRILVRDFLVLYFRNYIVNILKIIEFLLLNSIGRGVKDSIVRI